jgi:hypothetical protein
MRRVKVVPLSHRNPDEFVTRLDCTNEETWPHSLHRARTIIAKELGRPDVARKIVKIAVTKADACAVAFSNRSLSNARGQSRQKVSKAATRISICIRYTRAALRHKLNEAAQSNFVGDRVDLEVIAGFLNECRDEALKFTNERYAVRMLNELGWTESQDDGSLPTTLHLINEFEAMHPMDREAVEDDLRKLVTDQSSSLQAWSVFDMIAHSLGVPSVAEFREGARDLIVTYVSEVAKVWRESGLTSRRSHLLGNPDHRSWLHHFLELVLRDHFDLSPRRPKTVPENRYEWLISDEDLKTVMAADSEKST